jgi:hypothetical protein
MVNPFQGITRDRDGRTERVVLGRETDGADGREVTLSATAKVTWDKRP